MIYLFIGCLVIIGFLGFKLTQKQKLDKQALENYNRQLIDTRAEKKILDESIEYEKYKLEECRKDLQTALDFYQDITDNKLKEIDISIEEQRQKRQIQLDDEFKSKSQYYQKLLEETYHDCERQAEEIKQATAEIYEECKQKCDEYRQEETNAKLQYESLLEPIKQYLKDRQEKYFYTIQLPEEYQEDIEFLLTTVAAKVQHPDIISKLVWSEYVKPNIENTFKRIEIKPEPGIYKLTSLENGMAYVGKSTDVKKRIADHFKSVVGIKSIADQAVHHAILKEGFWNWTIEIITYCDKDKLSELEKYYIDFFKTQEFGYNKNAGG